MLVPINWDTLRPRKQKIEAWSNDTTKKEEKENQEKKEMGYGEDRDPQQQHDHLSLCGPQGRDEGPEPHGRQGPPLLRVICFAMEQQEL